MKEPFAVVIKNGKLMGCLLPLILFERMRCHKKTLGMFDELNRDIYASHMMSALTLPDADMLSSVSLTGWTDPSMSLFWKTLIGMGSIWAPFVV